MVRAICLSVFLDHYPIFHITDFRKVQSVKDDSKNELTEL